MSGRARGRRTRSLRALGVGAGAALSLAACADQPDAPGADAAPQAVALATPAVTMQADPPPPFTYWAPEGATIRNHPRDPAIWIAEGAGGSQTYYFGDQCRASEHQDWIGRPVEALPERPDGDVWRVTCTTCAAQSDLSRDRLNIAYDDATGRIVTVSCG